MGDAAVIQLFDEKRNEVSPVLRLHWHGNSAPEYIKECAKLMGGRRELYDAFARLVGICHTAIEGSLSVSVWNYPVKITEEDSDSDAGCYLVNVRTWDVDAFGGYGKPFNAAPTEQTA